MGEKNVVKPLTSGRLVEAIVKYRGLTINDLAEALRDHPMNVYKLINGSRRITEAMAIKIGKVLDVHPAIIINTAVLESLGMLETKEK